VQLRRRLQEPAVWYVSTIFTKGYELRAYDMQGSATVIHQAQRQ
jgi:hypothetical protein